MPVITICGQKYFSREVGIGTTPVAGTPLALPDGTSANPAVAFGSQPGLGLFRYSADIMGMPTGYFQVGPESNAGAAIGLWGVNLGLSSSLGFSTGNVNMATDAAFSREAAGVVAQKSGNIDQAQRVYGANGAYIERGAVSELITIAAAASTDSSANLLPANADIRKVTVRVVTAIPATTATFSVGDATTPGRFLAGVAKDAGTTAVGLLHLNPANAAPAGPVQAAAAKIRITPNAAPGAATGQVRVTVFYELAVPGTS